MGARGGRGPRFAPPRVPAPRLRARALQNRCACSGRPPPRPRSRGWGPRARGKGVPGTGAPGATPGHLPRASHPYFTETPG